MNKYEKAIHHLKGVQDNADRMKDIAEKRKEELEQFKELPAPEDKIKAVGYVAITVALVVIVYLIGNILGVPEFQWG